MKSEHDMPHVPCIAPVPATATAQRPISIGALAQREAVGGTNLPVRTVQKGAIVIRLGGLHSWWWDPQLH